MNKLGDFLSNDNAFSGARSTKKLGIGLYSGKILNAAFIEKPDRTSVVMNVIVPSQGAEAAVWFNLQNEFACKDLKRILTILGFSGSLQDVPEFVKHIKDVPVKVEGVKSKKSDSIFYKLYRDNYEPEMQ